MNGVRVSIFRYLAFLGAVAALIAVILTDDDGFIFLLDHANLLFHEAGHPLFGLFGEAPGLYGGTVGQLVFPLITAVVFWRQRAPTSFALMCVWFFENFFNIARYVADARVQELPLVGGGEHDWTNILSRWHILHRELQVAQTITVLGWLGIAATVAWLTWRWWKSPEEEGA